jgi:predicted nucleic acid-binding protein
VPSLFVDTSYLIARFNENDAFHEHAVEVANRLTSDPGARLTSTVMIAEEFLTDMSRRDAQLKSRAAEYIQRILAAPTFDVVDVDRALLERGIELYVRRLDKAYSMVDCISMVVCRDLGIEDVLTTDRDFEREGFVALLRKAQA